ncbi:heterokaryon incompatibility protein-domain-containing protein [Xylariales sp. PMI_506]|nr:heterokaryon incompatibility protein-domain-containing protein [Xylariales sp. PMI_506]
MSDRSSNGAQAFSKLIEPLTARLGEIEQRLGRIEGVLAKVEQHLANSSQPVNAHSDGQFSNGPGSQVPQKRPLQSDFGRDSPPIPVSYQYRALDGSKREIRLLRLDSSLQESDPIQGALLHMSLDDITRSQPRGLFGFSPTLQAQFKYKALSYTWDEPTLQGSSSFISIASASIQLTQNLDHALRKLRKDINPKDRQAYWWIDAICINQEDIEERNSQVALMRNIYANALEVQVWLGDEYDDSTEAIQLVKNLSNPPLRGPAHPKPVYPDIPRHKRLQNLASISSLLRRSWWDRVWVRQEAALGYELSFLCGNASCTLDELTTAERALGESVAKLRDDLKQQEMVHVMKIIHIKQAKRAEALNELRAKSRRGNEYINLCTLLFHARACKATDLRDKVFGVLGLADPDIYELAVDYRLPIRDVFLKAATVIISKTQRLDILSAAQNVDRVNSLPSWAPNLTDPWKAQPFSPAGATATINNLDQLPAQWHISESGKVLTVRGIVYDYIEGLSDQVARRTHSDRELHQILCTWEDYTKKIVHQKPIVAMYGGLTAIGSAFGDLAYEGDNFLPPLLMATHKPALTSLFAHQYRTDFIHTSSLLIPDTWIQDRTADPPAQDGRDGMRGYGMGRRAGYCSSGSIGLFPDDAREGDMVVFLYGAASPYVLRNHKGRCLLVGDANIARVLASRLKGKDQDFQLF